jgi:hypothetical protein
LISHFETSGEATMELQTKQLWMKPGEEFFLSLKNRGGCGLSLLFEGANDLVSVERVPAHNTDMLAPGDPVTANFRINANKPGYALIHFYETQVWNADFQRIPVLALTVNIEPE